MDLNQKLSLPVSLALIGAILSAFTLVTVFLVPWGQGESKTELQTSNGTEGPLAVSRPLASPSTKNPGQSVDAITATARIGVINADEKKHWDTIKYSGSINEFQYFLSFYPSGGFAPEAREAIRRLSERPADAPRSINR